MPKILDPHSAGLINGRAPGYWGRQTIHDRINLEFTTDKVMAFNYDKVFAMGLPFALWQQCTDIISPPLLQQCSCFKDTAKQPDVPCQSCYGIGTIPGYIKFGTQNYWLSSISSQWALTNLVLDTENRPFRLMLAPGQLSGTAISSVVPISVVGKLGVWEAKADAFVRDANNSTITVQFSTDQLNWWPLSQLEQQHPTLSLYFRVTLTRTAANIKSPMFEMLRARFPLSLDIRGELNEPVIRCIPTWDRDTENRTNYGTRLELLGKRMWTIPLTFFNKTLARDTLSARLVDNLFVEIRYGGNIGTRLAIIELAYSDTFGTFTRQEFGFRQPSGSTGQIVGEFYYRVF
jgi:hypothetical protein